MPKTISPSSDVQTPPPAKVSAGNTPHSPCLQIPAWEHHLPHHYIVASTPSTLKLQVEIETTDTQQTQSVVALLDSGATGLFLNTDYVQQHHLTTHPLSHPITVYNVNGMLNEAGSIHFVMDLVLCYQDHSEQAAFAVTSLGKQDMILGFTWLCEHNPGIDWSKEEAHKEQRAITCEHAAVCACDAGHLPYADLDLLSPLPLAQPSTRMSEVLESPDETIEVGDRIYATTLCPPPTVAEIQASQTTFQHLAEAFAANSQPKLSHSTIPNHLYDFEDVSSKASFDSLPEHKQWDHAIELIPDAEPSSCKVYPLTLCEQDELDAFLQENLSSGQIQPSKSPMASPVFFIKKKDGSLCLVQDYLVLNAMTVKNHYPLPLISELVNNLCSACYLTKLDVCWSYNNVCIKEGDDLKAAFQTNCRLFELLVMFFGLTNSPATFQTMMNDIFHDLIAEGVVCMYLDDILIYTKTLEEHCQVISIVLECLHQHQLYLKPEKCEFEQTQVENLGLIILHGTANMDPIKVAGVAEWPEPRDKKEVQAFLDTCNLCLPTKPCCQALMGQLHPLPIPAACWSVTLVDFIVELPDAHGLTSYLPTPHALPWEWPACTGRMSGNSTVCWMGVKLHTTMAYYPQSDGQTEHVNQELEQYLCLFCNERQDDWDELLPDTEFQYNNHVHSSTQMSPFFLDTGKHPCMGFEPWACPSENDSVNKFVNWMRRAQEEAKAALVKAKEDMAQYYDCRRTPAPVYKPGDCLCQLHPAFNVVKLFLVPEDPIPGHPPKPPPLPVLVNNEEEYEVEEILDSRVFQGKLKFKVKWKGYGIKDISWEL
ncbi:hypothetical protein E4T56_gene7297 [Termitomyces sp. T112]|nr:hypothetical protein E4T56_gene7297 [Termitomyces sp. T112]